MTTGGPLYARAEAVVVVVIGWEALGLLALAVVAILLSAVSKGVGRQLAACPTVLHL